MKEIKKKDKYVNLRSYQLVGIFLTVFVKEELVPDFREVETEISKSGFKGIAGNKGAVAIRFSFHQNSFCFVCAHLAAGQKHVEDRNRNFQDIMATTKFHGTTLIDQHEFILLFFNF